MTISDSRVRDIKLTKIDQAKAEKDGLDVKNELEKFAELGWEAIDKTDLELRLKWLGLFYRPVTPGQFMLRLRLPNGCLTSEQMDVLAQILDRYGADGNADVTTRQNLQLRGIRLEDAPGIFRKLKAVGLTSMQSGFDNVRNLTGSPVAGIDPEELIDTREILQLLQDFLTNSGEGNYAFSNLPRKFNIAIEGSRDNTIHSEMNDIAMVPAYRGEELGFNVIIGGYLSAQRAAPGFPMDVWIPAQIDPIIDLCGAILTVYTENGLREGLRSNRAKARLIWLVEKWGLERFRSEVEKHIGFNLERAMAQDEITMVEKRDFLGIHPQKQEKFKYVGLHIPGGRLKASEMRELSRLAEVYGRGELRFTVEQNVIIPHVQNDWLDTLLEEPLLQTFSPNPPALSRSMVSCTGAQFCNFAIIETKQRAIALAKELDGELNIPKRVRIHWTGCPNSCGQAQVGDIGLMGTKVRKDGKTVEGVNVFLGGKVGKHSKFGELAHRGIACDDLKDFLRNLLMEEFGATAKV